MPQSEPATSPSDTTSQTDQPRVFWYPDGFDLASRGKGGTLADQVHEALADGPAVDAAPGDILLIAHPGPVLAGAMIWDDGKGDFVETDQTVNWVSLGKDHRLSDIWTTWDSGAALSQTQIKAIADTCLRRGESRVIGVIWPLGDASEPDGATLLFDQFDSHESAVVTLRAARARARAQERSTISIEDVLLGLMAPSQSDPVSVALRNLMDPAARDALDAAAWATDVTPGPGCDAAPDVRELVALSNTHGSAGTRNATLLAALLRSDHMPVGALAALFPSSETAGDLAKAIVDQRERLAAEGRPDLKQIEFFEMATLGDPSFDGARPFLSPIPLTDLIGGVAGGSAPDPGILIPATRIDLPGDDDKLDIDEEAAAFARLIAYKKTRLPLSIGIFGHWGSGKTFFLNTVKRKLRAFEDEDYHKNVVTIDFNAWHYMETNIWASLVSVIFKGLLSAQRDDPDEPSTVRMLESLEAVQDSQLDAIDAFIKRAQAADEAQEAYVEAVGRIHSQSRPSWHIATAIFADVQQSRSDEVKKLEAALKEDFDDQSDAEKASRKRQLTAIDGDKNVFAFLDAAQEMIETGRLMQANFNKVFWSPRLLVIFAGALIIIPFALDTLADWREEYQALNSGLTQIISTLVTAAGVAAGWMRHLTGTVITAFDKVDAAVRSHPKLKDYEAERAKEVLHVDSARQRLKTRTEALEDARETVMVETVLGRLSNLIRKRAEGDTYTRHLGIIATIRADFENLSNLLAKNESREEEGEKWKEIKNNALTRLEKLEASAKTLIAKHDSDGARAKRLENEAIARDRDLPEAPDQPMARPGDMVELTSYGGMIRQVIDENRERIEKFEPVSKIDRVVLMIDDLDRCPPDKVYEVLQAVHLFLSFPLFVAMVAVDTRWMETSLKTQLGELVSGENGATPRDYLEKIFQIPYWAKALQPAQAESFVDRLLDEIDTRVTPPEPDTPATQVAAPGADAPATSPPSEDQTEPPTAAQDDDAPVAATARLIIKDAQDDDVPTALTGPNAEERAYLTKVSGFAGTTPRRVIRFLNIFLLIKTLPSSAKGIEYQRAIITQLALCVGMPEQAGAYFDEMDRTRDDQEIGNFVTTLLDRLDHRASRQVQGRIRALFATYAEANQSDPVKYLRATAGIARKFTFASPEAVELQSTGDGNGQDGRPSAAD